MRSLNLFLLFSILYFNPSRINSQTKKSLSKFPDLSLLIKKINTTAYFKSFNGYSKIGLVSGECNFSFLSDLKLLVRYTAQLPSSVKRATEIGKLSNFKFEKDGPYNTYSLTASWINNDKNSGSGSFYLKILGENYPNKIYVHVEGYNWKYYINLEFKPEDFQEIVNLLTHTGIPINVKRQGFNADSIREQKNHKEMEQIIRKQRDEKAKFDSINEENRLRLLKMIALQEQNRINDSLERNNLEALQEQNRINDSLERNNLKIFDLYNGGIVVKLDGNGHGLLFSRLLEYSIDEVLSDTSDRGLFFQKRLKKIGYNMFMDGSTELDLFKDLYKISDFRIKFKGSPEEDYFQYVVKNKEPLYSGLPDGTVYYNSRKSIGKKSISTLNKNFAYVFGWRRF